MFYLKKNYISSWNIEPFDSLLFTSCQMKGKLESSVYERGFKFSKLPKIDIKIIINAILLLTWVGDK